MGFSKMERAKDPSPAEIARKTAEIRKEWDDAEYVKRAALARSPELRIFRSWLENKCTDTAYWNGTLDDRMN